MSDSSVLVSGSVSTLSKEVKPTNRLQIAGSKSAKVKKQTSFETKSAAHRLTTNSKSQTTTQVSRYSVAKRKVPRLDPDCFLQDLTRAPLSIGNKTHRSDVHLTKHKGSIKRHHNSSVSPPKCFSIDNFVSHCDTIAKNTQTVHKKNGFVESPKKGRDVFTPMRVDEPVVLSPAEVVKTICDRRSVSTKDSDTCLSPMRADKPVVLTPAEVVCDRRSVAVKDCDTCLSPKSVHEPVVLTPAEVVKTVYGRRSVATNYKIPSRRKSSESAEKASRTQSRATPLANNMHATLEPKSDPISPLHLETGTNSCRNDFEFEDDVFIVDSLSSASGSKGTVSNGALLKHGANLSRKRLNFSSKPQRRQFARKSTGGSPVKFNPGGCVFKRHCQLKLKKVCSSAYQPKLPVTTSENGAAAPPLPSSCVVKGTSGSSAALHQSSKGKRCRHGSSSRVPRKKARTETRPVVREESGTNKPIEIDPLATCARTSLIEGLIPDKCARVVPFVLHSQWKKPHTCTLLPYVGTNSERCWCSHGTSVPVSSPMQISPRRSSSYLQSHSEVSEVVPVGSIVNNTPTSFSPDRRINTARNRSPPAPSSKKGDTNIVGQSMGPDLSSHKSAAMDKPQHGVTISTSPSVDTRLPGLPPQSPQRVVGHLKDIPHTAEGRASDITPSGVPLSPLSLDLSTQTESLSPSFHHSDDDDHRQSDNAGSTFDEQTAESHGLVAGYNRVNDLLGKSSSPRAEDPGPAVTPISLSNRPATLLTAPSKSTPQTSPRLVSPADEEYGLRLQDTIDKFVKGVDDIPSSSRSSRPVTPAPPQPFDYSSEDEENSSLVVKIQLEKLHRVQVSSLAFSEGVVTQTMGKYQSQGVQVNQGMIVDKEILDSYISVKISEAMYELNVQLKRTESQVNQVMADKEKLERLLQEKMQMIREMTAPRFKPVVVNAGTMTDPCPQSQSTPVRARPRRTRTRNKSVQTSIKAVPNACFQRIDPEDLEPYLRVRSETPLSSPAPESDKEANADTVVQDLKKQWMFKDTETCSRCVAFRPQVRLIRALKNNALNSTSNKRLSLSENASENQQVSGSVIEDRVSWDMLGHSLQKLFQELHTVYLVLRQLPIETVLKESASEVVSALGHLLSHLPIPDSFVQTFEGDSSKSCISKSAATYLLGWKMKQLTAVLKKILTIGSILPMFFKAELVQTQNVALKTFQFAVDGLRNETMIHGPEGNMVDSNNSSLPLRSIELPPLPMEPLFFYDVDDLNIDLYGSDTSYSSLTSSDSECEDTVIPLKKPAKRNQRNNSKSRVRRHTDPTSRSVKRTSKSAKKVPPLTKQQAQNVVKSLAIPPGVKEADLVKILTLTRRSGERPLNHSTPKVPQSEGTSSTSVTDAQVQSSVGNTPTSTVTTHTVSLPKTSFTRPQILTALPPSSLPSPRLPESPHQILSTHDSRPAISTPPPTSVSFSQPTPSSTNTIPNTLKGGFSCRLQQSNFRGTKFVDLKLLNGKNLTKPVILPLSVDAAAFLKRTTNAMQQLQVQATLNPASPGNKSVTEASVLSSLSQRVSSSEFGRPVYVQSLPHSVASSGSVTCTSTSVENTQVSAATPPSCIPTAVYQGPNLKGAAASSNVRRNTPSTEMVTLTTPSSSKTTGTSSQKTIPVSKSLSAEQLQRMTVTDVYSLLQLYEQLQNKPAVTTAVSSSKLPSTQSPRHQSQTATYTKLITGTSVQKSLSSSVGTNSKPTTQVASSSSHKVSAPASVQTTPLALVATRLPTGPSNQKSTPVSTPTSTKLQDLFSPTQSQSVVTSTKPSNSPVPTCTSTPTHSTTAATSTKPCSLPMPIPSQSAVHVGQASKLPSSAAMSTDTQASTNSNLATTKASAVLPTWSSPSNQNFNNSTTSSTKSHSVLSPPPSQPVTTAAVLSLPTLSYTPVQQTKPVTAVSPTSSMPTLSVSSFPRHVGVRPGYTSSVDFQYVSPLIQGSCSDNCLIIKWTLPAKYMHLQHQVRSYELYVSSGKDNASIPQWSNVGFINPLPLPMAVTLTNFKRGTFIFIVRALLTTGYYSGYSEACVITFNP